MSYQNPWIYRGVIFNDEHIEDNIAFVYIITSKIDGRKYIGKKLFEKRRTKKVGGTKKKIKTTSDWKTYYGSGPRLLDAVKNLGKENFIREILHLCKNKGTANYLESKELFTRGVLESDDWFNDWILVRVGRTHIKLSPK